MIDHTAIGVSDIATAAAFYDVALATLGMRRALQILQDTGTDGVGYGVDYPVLWIDRSLRSRWGPGLMTRARVIRHPNREKRPGEAQ